MFLLLELPPDRSDKEHHRLKIPDRDLTYEGGIESGEGLLLNIEWPSIPYASTGLNG